MGTYDTIGGTPRHDPAFDRNPPDVCIECEIDPDDCPGEDHCGLVRLARAKINYIRFRNEICSKCIENGDQPEDCVCSTEDIDNCEWATHPFDAPETEEEKTELASEVLSTLANRGISAVDKLAILYIAMKSLSDRVRLDSKRGVQDENR